MENKVTLPHPEIKVYNDKGDFHEIIKFNLWNDNDADNNESDEILQLNTPLLQPNEIMEDEANCTDKDDDSDEEMEVASEDVIGIYMINKDSVESDNEDNQFPSPSTLDEIVQIPDVKSPSEVSHGETAKTSSDKRLASKVTLAPVKIPVSSTTSTTPTTSQTSSSVSSAPANTPLTYHLETKLAKNIDFVLDHDPLIQELDRLRIKLRIYPSSKFYAEKYKSSLTTLQLKVSAKLTELKRSICKWEKDFFLQHLREPTDEDILNNADHKLEYSRISRARDLLEHWNITLHH